MQKPPRCAPAKKSAAAQPAAAFRKIPAAFARKRGRRSVAAPQEKARPRRGSFAAAFPENKKSPLLRAFFEQEKSTGWSNRCFSFLTLSLSFWGGVTQKACGTFWVRLYYITRGNLFVKERWTTFEKTVDFMIKKCKAKNFPQFALKKIFLIFSEHMFTNQNICAIIEKN